MTIGACENMAENEEVAPDFVPETTLERIARNTVTSENLAEFHAKHLAAKNIPDEVAEDAKPEDESEQSESIEQKDEAKAVEKPVNPKLEKRFSEITRQREEAKAEAAKERDARVSLENRLRELEQKEQPKPAQTDDSKPMPSQFNDAFEYAEALADYASARALRQRDQQDAERKASEVRDKVLNTWSEKLDAAKADLPDFDEMVQSADVAVPDYIRDSIIESDVGPKILYHLAENPDFAKSLAAMPAIKALRELGKLEAKFEGESPKTETKSTTSRSKAPDPISPIKGRSSATDTPVTSDGEFKGTYAQYVAARKAGKIR